MRLCRVAVACGMAAVGWTRAEAAGPAPAPRPGDAPAALTLTLRSRLDEPAAAWAPKPPELAPRLRRAATVSYAISDSTTIFMDVRKDKRPGGSAGGDRDRLAPHLRGGRGYMFGLKTRW